MKHAIIFLSIIYVSFIFFGCKALSGKSKSATLDKSEAIDTIETTLDSLAADTVKTVDTTKTDIIKQPLSSASKIMINACNNYINVNPESPKVTEVLNLKASVYHNNKLFDQSRKVYHEIINKHPKTPEAVEATRMIAQSYYELKEFDKAQEWYRKLKEEASEEGSKNEAVARIAESIFRMAEMHEKEQRFNDAAAQYERVALEYPEAPIADVSLFNAGLCYEKEAEWPRAILVYQRLKSRYPKSKIIPKSMSRNGKCYEKLMQWDDAAQTYLRLVANYPTSEFSSTSLYNAGFCFENAGKLTEAAATFEKHAMAFPKSKDAADILFKAGEIYGQIKDWESVTRVNKEFSRRYGGDKDRIVQAQCMVGVALYMQNKPEEAVSQLVNAITTFSSLKNPSDVNKFYAAKAQFTIGDIYHEFQNKVTLIQPKNVYKKRLKEKSQLLDKSVEAYSRVVKYKISEWTIRAIYQIGQSYEDFAVGIFKQERPKNLTLEKSLALEMGIAKAVEEYFIENALRSHEQNVKLGIKEKIENKSILNSKEKLTYLPYAAGENFLALLNITKGMDNNKSLTGFALIAHKLQTLQKMAPFQERAIGLFLKCLEMGSMYQEYNEIYKKASSLITKTSFIVAETYGEVAEIARSAPIPKDFNAYEKFVYKTKLLKQIEEYEENALSNYLKTVKISQAYNISDEYVQKTKMAIPKLLFNRGRCYDLLCISAFRDPPYPANINEAEKEEYRAQFEEIALTYQEQAFEIYRGILDYTKQEYAEGDYVDHAYVRLYQNYPEELGVKTEKIETKNISSGPKWKCTQDSFENWHTIEYNDQNWHKVSKEPSPQSASITGFPDKPPVAMWYKNNPQSQKVNRVFFRRSFYIKEPPHQAKLFLAAIDNYTVFINEEKLPIDSAAFTQWNVAQSWDLTKKVRRGKNVLSVDVRNNNGVDYGLFPYLKLKVTSYDYLPKFPNTEEALDKKSVSENFWTFPHIENFSLGKK